MNYIDCHCHLIHNVDDGSGSLEESKRNLELLRSQGVTKVFLTPHVNSPASLPGVVREQLLARYSELVSECRREPDRYPEPELGCEYFFAPYKETSMDPLPMGRSRFVLLELPYETALNGVVCAVQVAQAHGWHVLLAHPEKYAAFQYQWDEALMWLRRSGVKVQVEAWNTQKCDPYTWQFIETGTAHVLGTDSHGDRRYPVFDLAAEALWDWAGTDLQRQAYVRRLTRENAIDLLGA